MEGEGHQGIPWTRGRKLRVVWDIPWDGGEKEWKGEMRNVFHG